MLTKTITAVSALLLLGSASVAFASTDVLRETQLDFAQDGAPFVETIAKPRPAINNWGPALHDSGAVNAADY
jgi:hypothetical protein